LGEGERRTGCGGRGDRIRRRVEPAAGTLGEQVGGFGGITPTGDHNADSTRIRQVRPQRGKGQRIGHGRVQKGGDALQTASG